MKIIYLTKEPIENVKADYVISTAEEFNNLTAKLNDTYKLIMDKSISMIDITIIKEYLADGVGVEVIESK